MREVSEAGDDLIFASGSASGTLYQLIIIYFIGVFGHLWTIIRYVLLD